ncbi:hypothetical protein P43SY_007502 [Pythium insidiosum]|uniref:Endonuclease/exonuclease/phosphatase domain-containing protein n=1 Tax=Pythium insidiosum TaxID=114742 RepID=A0AAD5Q786_PYTIN|nr:hypothetical protein P43SY_007502 [Pythium insidiosum]
MSASTSTGVLGASTKPLAVCVGMGVAMLASVQMSRHHRQLWRALGARRLSAARRLPSSETSGVLTLEDVRPRYLDCVQQRSQTPPARLSTASITVVQFNILARNLATRNHFPYVMDSSLNWENRKRTLLRQLEELDADVVCLEELSDYWTFFKPELHELGYDSVYIKRPSIHISNWSGERKQDGCGIFYNVYIKRPSIHISNWSGERKQDGCGIFYKKDKLELKECECVNFHDPHDRVAVLALLKLRHWAQYVLVGCTHLWWNAKKVDHQMAELFELEEEIIRMSSDVKDKYSRDLADTITGHEHIPIIICGDFNNSPESPLYEYMESSFMQKPNLEGVQEPFRSAYALYRQNAEAVASAPEAEQQQQRRPPSDADRRDEPPHTTVNFRRCWTIDYIWYSQRSLVPTRVLDIPSEAVLRAEDGPAGWFNRLAMSDSYSKSGRLPSGFQGNHNGIPNSMFGSDHVPIMAEFEFLHPASGSAEM